MVQNSGFGFRADGLGFRVYRAVWHLGAVAFWLGLGVSGLMYWDRETGPSVGFEVRSAVPALPSDDPASWQPLGAWWASDPRGSPEKFAVSGFGFRAQDLGY